jgi:hypothetical protein
LLSQARERRLGFAQRTGLRLHLLLCDACRNFRKQLEFLHAAATAYPGERDKPD